MAIRRRIVVIIAFSLAMCAIWLELILTDNSRYYPATTLQDKDVNKTSEDLDGITSLEDKNVTTCEASLRDFRSASGLFCIVTGCANSGTTIVGSLINSAPNLFGAIECGMLNAATPSKFRKVHPFYQWMLLKTGLGFWALSEDQRESLLNASCHAEMFVRLKKYSPLYRYPHNASWIVDKTPRYIDILDKVMDLTPGVPVVVTVKNDEDQIRSWRKRGGSNLAILSKRLQRAKDGLDRAIAKYPKRVFVVNTTELMNDPSTVMTSAYEFLGLQWKSEYLSMDALNEKWAVLGLPKIFPFDKNATKNKGMTKRFENADGNVL